MGKTPDNIKAKMNETRVDIEGTVDSLKANATSKATSAKDAAVAKVGNLGTKAGDATQSVADKIPTMDNAMPLVIACTVVGFAAGFAAPLSGFERKQLQPLGQEITRRLKDTRQEIVGQSRAVVEETVGAAKSSLNKHGKEAAENIGV